MWIKRKLGACEVKVFKINHKDSFFKHDMRLKKDNMYKDITNTYFINDQSHIRTLVTHINVITVHACNRKPKQLHV